jgi:hypothetical protein
MSNKGWEFDLKAIPILNANLKWEIGLNYSFADNKVLEIADGLDEVSLGNGAYAIKGQPFPVIKGSDWTRDPQGRVIVDPISGFPIKDPILKVFGGANAKYKLGINTRLSYMGISLSATVDYRDGGLINNNIGRDLDFTGISTNSTQAGRQRFIFPNSVIETTPGVFTPNTTVLTQDGNWQFWANTYSQADVPYITSAAFWKLREVSLSYQLPTPLISRLKGVKGVSLGITGRNLLMFVPKTNIWTDPEFNEDTSNAVGLTTIRQTPPTRIFGFNINVTF